jgi:hypothetical protein
MSGVVQRRTETDGAVVFLETWVKMDAAKWSQWITDEQLGS